MQTSRLTRELSDARQHTDPAFRQKLLQQSLDGSPRPAAEGAPNAEHGRSQARTDARGHDAGGAAGGAHSNRAASPGTLIRLRFPAERV
jgi:hypothetical protein